MTRLGGHDPFEHAPEHVRSYAALWLAFSDGEVKPLEQPVKRVTPEVVGNVRGKPPLQDVRLEEAAVEEWNGTKGRGAPAASVLRPVQSAEEQWTEQIPLYPAAPPQAAVYLLRQEPFSAGEPPLRLYEIEKQHSRELKKRETMPVIQEQVAG